MVDASSIQEHAEVIGVHLGTVDHVDRDRIKLSKSDSSQFEGQGGKHHWISIGLVADVEDGKVRLSANADVAADMFEEAE